MSQFNTYYDSKLITQRIKDGGHRGVVGGLWEELGKLQFDYLVSQGLKPQMTFLDIGCGCLRGGVHFINFLEPGHYYGLDLSQALLDVGYDQELAQAGLQDKLPKENLLCTDRFELPDSIQKVDMAIALSVFTHLPLNSLKLCLLNMTNVVVPGGKIFASVFVANSTQEWGSAILHKPGGITTHPDRDPFHYQQHDLEYCCQGLQWELESLKSWNHPRDQWMATFVRLD